MDSPTAGLCWLLIISLTLNVTGACSWLLDSLRDRRGRRDDGEAALSPRPEPLKMYRVVDLAISQALAMYALVLFFWLPLLNESFMEASPLVASFTLPAVCVAVGRHVFCSLRGWRCGRSAIPSVAHAVSAACHLLFLKTAANLVFAALAMVTELGNVYLHVSAALGERRAAGLPTWTSGLGVILAVIFNGLVYLVVLALALARRSPLLMPPLAIGLFFFYVTFSFIMNTYSIYLVMAAFFNGVLEARVSAALQRTSPARHAPSDQALANIKSTLAGGGDKEPPDAEAPRSADPLKFSDGDLLIKNMV